MISNFPGHDAMIKSSFVGRRNISSVDTMEMRMICYMSFVTRFFVGVVSRAADNFGFGARQG